MRICFTGSFGNRDIGDEAMVFPHLALLSSIGLEKKDIYLVGHKPGYTSQHFDHPRDKCLTLSKFNKRKMPNVDAMIFTGGGTINERPERGILNLLRTRSVVQAAVSNKIPVFMSGQTIGPLKKNKGAEIARDMINSVDVLTLRDHIHSWKYLKIIGARTDHIAESTDDAAALPYLHEVLPVEPGPGRNAVLNTTTYTGDTAEKRQFMARVGAWLEDQGYHVYLLPHAEPDHKHLKAVKKLLPSATFVNTNNWRGSQSKKFMSLCDLVVAGRYHCLVFAMTAGVPCVGMAPNLYSRIKQDGFARQLGLQDCVSTMHGAFDLDHIKDLIARALHRKQQGGRVVLRPIGLLRAWLNQIPKGA